MLQTRNVHVSHSGPSDQLDLGSNHRSVCAHCKSDAINVKTANQAQMVVQGVCAEIPSCNCGKLTLLNSAKHIESIVVPCANAAAKEPHTHHPTPLQQPHFQSPLDLRRGCRDKRERCCLSFFARAAFTTAQKSPGPRAHCKLRAKAARSGGDCVVHEVPERRELRTRHGPNDVWRAEQRRSKRALQSNAEQAPPAAQPTLGSGTAQGGRSALGTKPHELRDKVARFRTPASAQLDTRGCIDAGAPGAATRGTLCARFRLSATEIMAPARVAGEC